MKTTVRNKLLAVEKEHNIQLLFTCESGSRAWGFPSPDSDYDVRFIYLRSLDYYLSVQKKDDQLSFPIVDELDIFGWDLRKVLQLLVKSNVTPFEWLQSPIMYVENDDFRSALWDVCQHYFCARRNAHHYIGIASGAMEGMNGSKIKIKKLFYVLRPLLSALWCIDRSSIAPMSIEPLMQLLPTDLRKLVLLLIEQKSTVGEGFEVEVAAKLQQWISETASYCLEKSNLLERKQLDVAIADSFFRKMVLKQ